MSWRGGVIAAGVVVLVAAGTGVALDATGAVPWAGEPTVPRLLLTPSAPPAPDWSPAAEVLAAPAAAPATGAPAFAGVLGPLVAAPALGGQVGASVVDLSTGATVYESGADSPRIPASTLKILTAAAALHALGPDHTFTTRVVTASPSLALPRAQLTLVGGGDPSLTADGDASGTRLTELADDTAQALTDAGVTTMELTFDDSLFAGPAIDPDWSSGYLSGGIVSPTSALAADVADTRPGDPALAAATTFADLLRARGVSVDGDPVRGSSLPEPTEIASVTSRPLSTLVERILDTSDNDGAEVLARHVARAAGLPGTSDDASNAMTEALASLGLDLSGVDIRDGSGLARGSAVPASLVAEALVLAAGPEHPELRSVVTGLPIAGFSGTLLDRFDGDAGTAVGLVRAKTGTLTGVSALAGVVLAADGTSYAFAVLADDVAGTAAARDGLDDVAAALTACGCA